MHVELWATGQLASTRTQTRTVPFYNNNPSSGVNAQHVVAQRVVSARAGPRLKRMHTLDIGKDALSLETAGFEFKPIMANDVLS